METTAVTENTEGEEHLKSDVDSDCGSERLMPSSPSPGVQPTDNFTHDDPEKGQERSVDDLIDSKSIRDTTESPRPRPSRRGSRSQSKESSPTQRCPKGVDGKANQQQSISQRNRVNGLIVQNKRARGMKDAEKLRHVNEAWQRIGPQGYIFNFSNDSFWQ